MNSTQLSISNNITYKNLDEKVLSEITQLCSGKNPAYSSYLKLLEIKPYLKYSKSLKIPPSHINLTTDTEIPRGVYQFLIDKGYTIQDNTASPKAKFTLKFTLRDYQDPAVDAMASKRFGTLCAPTASGKTSIGFGLVQRLGLKTLFIVHTSALLDQVKKEAKKKLGIDVGIIGQGKTEIKDFTVGLVQSLVRKDLSKLRNEFGLIIVDEAHRVPSTTFTKVLSSFNASRVYGLTATPNRQDGLTWVLYSVVGPLIYTIDKVKLQEIKAVMKPKVLIEEIDLKHFKKFQSFDIANHLNYICEHAERNKIIIQYINKILKEHPKAQPLILTSRIDHINLFAKEFKSFDPIIFHSKMSKEEHHNALELIKNRDNKFTISTYNSVAEGFDVPLWDTLFLTVPFASEIRLSQTIGRISRPALGKKVAYVHDFADINDEVLMSRFRKRLKIYKEL